MLKAIKRALSGAQVNHSTSRHEVQVAAAVLLHEARRADYAEHGKEAAAAQEGLTDLFGLEPQECTALLEEGRLKAAQLSSFYGPVSVVKREFSMEDRIRLVEHLWSVSFAEGGLHWYEDHYVRKIAHLLYVPNTQAMLARNRARPSEGQ